MNHYTAHQARYFAWELSGKRASSEQDRLSQSLFDAHVDVNPHQIEAALFALNNPLSKGVILADEVSLDGQLLKSEGSFKLGYGMAVDMGYVSPNGKGQKIFTITQDNLSLVLPQLSHKATVIQDVKNAVAAGKIVTISQTMISYQGWTGTGYILLDPQTGAGACLTGGGQDGGFLKPLDSKLAAWLTGLGLGMAFGALLTLTGLGLALSIVLIPIILFYAKYLYEDWFLNNTYRAFFWVVLVRMPS